MSLQIVIVDDTPFNLRVLTEMLRKLDDVRVEAFGAARDALAWSAEHETDCFVIDYVMPEMNGIELARALRRQTATAYVPIIMVTVRHERGIRYEALDAGVNDFVERPLDRREFQARIVTFLALQQARKRLAMHIDELTASLVLEEHRSRQHARRLESLWQIMTLPQGEPEDILAKVLGRSAAALRPGEPFVGHFIRIDGDEMIVEIVAHEEVGDALSGALRKPGERIALETSRWAEVVDAGETRYWNDLAADPEIAGLQMVRRMDWRSAIMKAFAAGGTTYIVMFLSQQVPEEPFQADDVSFVDIVTSIFQVHVQQRWQSDRIRFQLEHDPLTGAINRSRFRSLGRMTSEPSGPTAAIAIVDLEAFREVNNAYGSLTGDALLVEVAAALSVVSASGNAELVGRIGGDKFGVWMPALENAAALHERIAAYRRVFEHPFSTGDREGRHFIGLDARIGIAVSTDSSIAFDELMSRADAALYLAKRDRDTMTKYFVAGMELDYRDRKRYAGELLEAIAHEQFSLHVQPHIDLHTMRVVGAEALVRWDHPERGLVMPNDFIPFAEANGLIGQIDAWVLGRAIAIGEFLAEEFAGFRLFFNVSLIDLDTDVLLERLRYVLRSGRGKNLGIELTESGLMRDTRATMQMTTALQSSGMHVAIDDFGTGYSSLAYLKRLPFDVIKIDQSFVRNLPHDPHDLAICEAILSIGARFGKAVLAEGVETLEQLFWLRERGCTLAQGYAICKPIPVDEFLSWTSPFADREWADEPPGESGSGG